MEKIIQLVKGAIALAFGVLAGWLGGADSLLRLLLGLMVADFLFGIIKGIRAKKLSSAIMVWGFVNKVFCLLLIFICVLLDAAIFGDGTTIRNIGIIWFVICEGCSILENSAAIGLPLPEQLRDILVQAKKGFSINITKVVQQIIDNYNSGKGDSNHDNG